MKVKVLRGVWEYQDWIKIANNERAKQDFIR